MLGLRESDLLAVHLPPGEHWQALLGEAWDAGAAVLPVDHRLPEAAVSSLLSTARPTVVLDAGGARRVDGEGVGPGTGLVMATSGSAGPMRLVELEHPAVASAVRASIERLGATASDPWLCALPLAHMGGLLVLLRAATLGAPVRFGDALEPGARFASVVPTQLIRAGRAHLEGYRAVLVGGAALDPALREDLPVVATYGLTESCGGVVYDGVPLDGVSIRIGEDGEIQLLGPMMMRGYRSGGADAFTSDGWLRTRDAGAMVDGRLIVQGRLDDVIVTGGEKVWPDEVEAVLRTHPSVRDVAVAGRWDPEWGARVVAYVVPAGSPAPSLASLRSFAAEQLARYKAPRELVLVESLPRTTSGKVARSALPAPARAPFSPEHQHVPPS